MEAETVAKIIVEQVLTQFGVSFAIHTELGIQFESQLFSKVY